MKIKNIILSFFCILSLLFSTTVMNVNASSKLDYSHTETESIKSYQKITNCLNNVHRNRSISIDNNNIISNNYGGSYLDTNGFLHVNLVDNSDYIQEKFNKIAENDSIIYNQCNFSYLNLYDIYNELCEKILYYEIKEISILESQNKVIINGGDIDKINVDFSDELNAGVIDFNNSEFNYSDCATYDLKAGDSISNGSSTSTISFCAKDNAGNKGFVMAGHGVNAVGDTVYFSGKKVGKVTFRKYSGTVDAAFVQIQNGLFTKFNTTYKLTDNSDIWSWLHNNSIPEGTQLTKYGTITNQTTGKVISNTTTVTVDGVVFSDMVRTSIYALKGDSGGPVIKVIPSGKCLVGICKGTATYSNGTVELYFTKIDNILNAFNIWPILCP